MSTPKTLCAIARKSPTPFAIASQADKDTASCRPPAMRGWPPLDANENLTDEEREILRVKLKP